MDARDADPPRQRAAPVPVRRRPFVMTAKLRGGDDGHRQNLRVGDVRTPQSPLKGGGFRAISGIGTGHRYAW